MSSTHPDYDPNRRIKNEPGTENEQTITTPLISDLITNIKTEPKFPSTSNRLPSFRVPRDLTLGGNIKLEKPKKVYVPNLNVQRIKNREDQNTTNKNDSSLKDSRKRNQDKERGDKNKDKNKNRGKTTNNLIQSSGIFSEGLADLSSKKYSSFRDRDANDKESIANLERPKLSIPTKIDKVEEAEKLKALLKDDFIDDGLDIDLENTPVVLPLIGEGKLFKTECNSNKNDFLDEKFILQNGEGKIQNQIKLNTVPVKIKKNILPLTVPEVIENKSNNFILMQLPDCLPGLQNDPENDSNSKRTAEPNSENDVSKFNKFCTLNNLNEGMLGKLQILRSGKAQLKLGDNNLIIDVGSNLSFRQDLIAAKISSDKQRGDLLNLGTVSSTLVCSPDWEKMLKNL